MIFSNKQLHDYIGTAAGEVVEKMFNTAIVPVYENLLFPYEIIVTIGFKGKFEGNFWIIIPQELGLILTSRFLNMDASELSPELIHDTIKEIVNMVCGNIIFKFDKQSYFEITIPDIFIDTNAHNQIVKIPESAHSFSFTIEDQPLRMVLDLAANQ